MANRSDFESATLPRSVKKRMALMDFKDGHERGEFKRMMIEAHARAKAFKAKKRDYVDTSESSDD